MDNIFNLMPVEVIGIMNTIFSPLLAMDPNPSNPALTILVIAFIVSLISNVAGRYLVDRERAVEIQGEISDFNEQLRKARKANDGDELAKLQLKQPKILKLQSEMMLNSLKPMLVTYLPIILIISWMRASAVQGTVIILPKVVYWLTLTPLWHMLGSVIYGGHAGVAFGIGWLLWYMFCSFGANQILKNFFEKKIDV